MSCSTRSNDTIGQVQRDLLTAGCESSKRSISGATSVRPKSRVAVIRDWAAQGPSRTPAMDASESAKSFLASARKRRLRT